MCVILDLQNIQLSVFKYILYSCILWMVFFSKTNKNSYRIPHLKVINKIFILLVNLFFFNISAGAWVSGTDAGLSCNNFPLMGDSFLPPILSTENDYSFDVLLMIKVFCNFLTGFLLLSHYYSFFTLSLEQIRIIFTRNLKFCFSSYWL